MTIVHTVPSISNEASGPSYSVRRLCESLLERGADITLATLAPTPPGGPSPYLKTFARGIGPARLGRSPEMHHWLDRAARSGNVSLLHNHSLWMMPNVYAGRIARRHRLPFVVAPRGTFTPYSFASGSYAKRFFWPLVQKPALEAVTGFHATAQAECDDIRRMGFRQPIAIIPNGVDIPAETEAVGMQIRTLLYLGRLHPEKGIEMLLRAWCAVSPSFPEWQLRIVGPDVGGYERELRQLATQLALKRVDFAGPAYGAAKRVEYSDAELFILPSPSENFGMAVAEALAAGTPVITTKGAPWRALEWEGAGWWTEITVEGLADALSQAMAESPEALLHRGQRGRAWMSRDFSWSAVAQLMDQYYRWLLTGGRVPACVAVN